MTAAAAATTDGDPLPIGAEDAAQFVSRAYGIVGAARMIACERDQLFHVTVMDGREFLLKIFHPDESNDAIRLETAALTHIAARDPALPVQRAVPAADGALETVLIHGGGRPRTAKLLTYLPGPLLASVPVTSSLRRQIGTALARLDIALADFAPDGIARELIWDMQRALALRPLLAHIDEEPLRALVAKTLDAFEQIKPRFEALPKQPIHNDFNPYNVLVGADGALGGIIDFGDLVSAPRVCDLAVAASYHAADLSHLGELVNAYLRSNPLRQEELDLLPALIRTRHAMSITISSWRSKLYPENAAYILRNAPSARAGLLYLSNVSEDALKRAWK